MTPSARVQKLRGPRNFWTLADGVTIPVSKAEHFVLGASHIFDDLNLNVELFHKEYDGLSEFTERNSAIRNEEGTGLTLILEQEFNKGSGSASGIELFLQKNIGSLTGWIGYTFSEVLYDFPTISDKTFFANHDSTHEFKTLVTVSYTHLTLPTILLV